MDITTMLWATAQGLAEIGAWVLLASAAGAALLLVYDSLWRA